MRTLAVLGSGGHTAELVKLVKDWRQDRYQAPLRPTQVPVVGECGWVRRGEAARLEAGLAAGDPHNEILVAWQCYQKLRAVYLNKLANSEEKEARACVACCLRMHLSCPCTWHIHFCALACLPVEPAS